MRSDLLSRTGLFLLLICVSGCGGNSGTSAEPARIGGETPVSDSPPGLAPLPDETCAIVFEKSRVEAYQREASMRPGSHLVVPVFRPMECRSGDRIHRGYTQLTVQMPVQPVGRLQILNGEAVLPFRQIRLTSEEKNFLALQLGATRHFNEERSFFEAAFKGSLAEFGQSQPVAVSVGFVKLDGILQSVLKFNRLAMPESASWRDQPVSLWDGPAGGYFQITSLQTLDYETAVKTRVMSTGDAITDSWKRLDADTGAADGLRVTWISQYTLWARSGFKAGTPSALAPLVAYANQVWSTREALREESRALLAYLEFLAEIDPQGAAREYIIQRAALLPYLEGKTHLLIETLRWVDEKPYSAVQQAFIFRFAEDLKSLGVSDPWSNATQLSDRLEFDDQKYRAMNQARIWLHSPIGPSLSLGTAFNRATRYFTEMGAVPSDLEGLTYLYPWLASSAGPGFQSSVALEEAERLVLKGKANYFDIDLMTVVYSWLQSETGPSLNRQSSYQKATAYVLEQKMTGEQLDLLRRRFTEIRHHLDSSGALTQAEKEVFGN